MHYPLPRHMLTILVLALPLAVTTPEVPAGSIGQHITVDSGFSTCSVKIGATNPAGPKSGLTLDAPTYSTADPEYREKGTITITSYPEPGGLGSDPYQVLRGSPRPGHQTGPSCQIGWTDKRGPSTSLGPAAMGPVTGDSTRATRQCSTSAAASQLDDSLSRL